MDRRARRKPKLALAHAAELRQLGRLDEAQQVLREILVKEPGLVEALHLLGIVQSERGDASEALATMERAMSLAPSDVDLQANLGRVAHLAGELVAAETHLRKVLARRSEDLPSRGVLAAVLEESGRLDDASAELRAILAKVPADSGALFALARILRQQRRHEEEVAVAHELRRLRPDDPALTGALSRSYFLWFDSVDQEPERARAVLAAWRAFDPEDPVARHMEAAHSPDVAPPARASNGYIERHFDEFASSFDEVLGGLDYRGPALLAEALAADGEPRADLDIADLGCGTGASGEAARPWARHLVGVDLSRKMVAAARARGAYDDVKRAEIRVFLAAQRAAFDRVLCADTLPYLGDLRPLFTAVCASLRPAGIFIATTEIEKAPTGDAGYRLQTAGRYAHEPAYVRRELERAGLSIGREVTAELRKENGRPVEALVFSARRSKDPRD